MSTSIATTIYALVDHMGTVRYVGKTVELDARIARHRQARPWCAGHVVLEVVPPGGDWRAAECRHIAEWNWWGDLENVRGGGVGGERQGPEARARISAGLTGKKRRPFTPEHLAALSAAAKKRGPASPALMEALRVGNLGRIPTPEHRAKISVAKRGKTHTPEARAKMSAAAAGRTLAPEHRAKLSAAHLGKKYGPRTPEARALMSAAKTGKKYGPLTAEHRAKISAALKGRPRGRTAQESSCPT